jgi:hypothetical protein
MGEQRPPQGPDGGRRPPRGEAPGDVERRAVEQAGAVIGRFLDLLGGDRAGGPGPDPAAGAGAGADDPLAGEPPPPDFARMRADLARSVDLVLDLFRRTFDSYADLVETSLRQRGVRVAGGDGEGPDELVLEGDAGDEVVTGALFVHNFSGAPIGPVDPRVTDLFAHDGDRIDAGEVSLDPPSIDKVPDGATVRIAVAVATAGRPAGRWHGHALLAETALPVRLVLRAP